MNNVFKEKAWTIFYKTSKFHMYTYFLFLSDSDKKNYSVGFILLFPNQVHNGPDLSFRSSLTVAVDISFPGTLVAGHRFKDIYPFTRRIALVAGDDNVLSVFSGSLVRRVIGV